MNARSEQARNELPVPWYRHYYVWLLITFPALAVIGGITTLFVAANTFDGLVVDDYYKHGLEINRTFERDRAALKKNLSAELMVAEESRGFRVILKGNDRFRQPDRIEINFIHATRPGLDQSASLVATGGSLYEGDMPQLPPGIWNVTIEAQDWRLLKRWHNN